jgi:hypothetical protein
MLLVQIILLLLVVLAAGCGPAAGVVQVGCFRGLQL